MRSYARSVQTARFWPCVLCLLFGAWGCRAAGAACVYERDEKDGFLRIVRLAPGDDYYGAALSGGNATVKTKLGERNVCHLAGDCKWLFFCLLPGSRRVVETKDHSCYSIFVDDFGVGGENGPGATKATVAEIADKLGLEIVPAQRRHSGFVIRKNSEKPTNIERFRGRPKWPDLRGSGGECGAGVFSNGGVYTRPVDETGKDDGKLYFDGVSLDELAKYFEHFENIPVVNETGDSRFYSFALPQDRKSFSFKQPVPLPGLGLSVAETEPEVDVTLVRDKQPTNAAGSPNGTKKPVAGGGSQEPQYEGKSLGYWLAQTKDKDAETRFTAVVALGGMGSGAKTRSQP